MIANICCSGSSGSTFFSSLLNRHPDIVCGDELGLFSKPVVFDDYLHLKKWHTLIRIAGISSRPYFEDRSILRNLESFGLKKDQVWNWIVSSEGVTDLADKLESHILGITGKRIWAEKTPGNIFLVDRFVRDFPHAKVIHIVRDPRDVVLSLMGRGVTIHEAAEIWLTSVSAIWNYRTHPRVLEITYEDLILKAEETLGRVCAHMEVEFDMSFFTGTAHESKSIVKVDGFNTWSSRPADGFSSKSVGKYKKSDIDFSEIQSMTLSSEFASLLGTKEFSVRELAGHYGYNLEYSDPGSRNRRGVSVKRWKSIVGRIADIKIEKVKKIQKVFY